MSAKIWTAANVVMVLLFLFSASLQFNDPDPVQWVAVYTAAAVISGMEAARRTRVQVPIALALIAVVWAGFIASDVHNARFADMFAQWEMKNVQIEEERETYGLLIVAAWMIGIAVATWRRRSPAPARAPEM
ncbi:MAG TPA: transmembrane 220 family protein [Gemmatimonadaceae bacterium]|nr:transmembrane 220 family protein [Gemmatimonadaceae bacterium]